MNIIRCDLKDYLVWKWRPQFNDTNDSPGSRSNFVRWGSSLRVKDGEMAVFVYRGSDADHHDNQDFIMGPYDGIIHSANLPVISRIIGAAYGGSQGGPFQAEIYFINLQGNNQVLFGIPYFDVFDSRYPDLAVPVAARGTITFNLTDYQQFIKLNRLTDFSLMDFKNQIRGALIKHIKNIIINKAGEEGMSVMRLESKLLDVSNEAEAYVRKRFTDDFGVNLKAFDLEAINLDKNSEGYQQLKGLTHGIMSRTVKAQTDINLRNLDESQKWNSENARRTMEIQREEMQRAQRLQTESQYMSAHALDQQTRVGVAFAEGMGQSGSMNAGGGGMNPAGMMAGMAVGGAMGQQMAGMVNQMGQTVNQSYQQATQQPPMPPQMEYYTFIRPDELTHVRIQDLYLKEQKVYISDRVSKNSKDGMVGLNDDLIKLMVELKVFGSPGNWYLFGKNFRPSEEKADSRIFREKFAVIRGDLRWPDSYQFYSLKDSGIRDLANSVGVVVARDQARHSDVTVTNRYLKGDGLPVHEETKHFHGNL